MRFETAQPPQWQAPSSVAGMMRVVILALLPAVGVSAWFYGPGILFNIAVASLAALGTEALALRLRHKPVAASLGDGSALVAALLFAFALPPLCPWWVTATGMVFAIGLVKHAYGGLGYNLFNPAMAGYVLVLVSFPDLMTGWPPPDIGDLDYQRPGIGATLQYGLTGRFPDALTLDAVTRATTLDRVREGLGAMRTMDEIRMHPVFGDFGGAGWEWVNNFVAIGGAVLLWLGIIRWHTPAGVLGGLLGMASLFWLMDPEIHASPGMHLFSGGAMLGAFFVATDPVSSPTTARGRLIYGGGIGVLTYVIRSWGSYADGIAFAVLLMNMAVPLIERWTRPRIYGWPG
ncbi:MAG: RnfABCDGE type electron transport complex subunit D [Gammaproteobacteria bacterium]|nr:RnfABCDGE type electron transport complex subunit D [Gammaproteobacteria bacterium]